MGITIIVKPGRGEDHRQTRAVVRTVDKSGDRGKTFIVPNLSGKYISDHEAREIAQENADKAGLRITRVETRYSDTNRPVEER